MGGWSTFEGDLHSHSRGHYDSFLHPTPNASRGVVASSALFYGYDFFSITNHTTSWKDYDGKAPLHMGYLTNQDVFSNVPDDGSRPMDMLELKGIENYLGYNDRAHFSAFNNLFRFQYDDLVTWHNSIIANYNADPLLSTHIQLNHPGQPGIKDTDDHDPYFQLPSGTGSQRSIVRDAIETAEYTDFRQRDVYFELLRRGFRVSPVANMDGHSNFRQYNANWNARNPDGTWKVAYIEQSGVPRELWDPDETSRTKRTGIVIPANQAFSYGRVLEAMRLRHTYRTGVLGASGFFVVNGNTMGSELTLPWDASWRNVQLDFTVWATTKNGMGGGYNEWKRLEVWSPNQPDHPIKTITYDDPNLVDLKQTFSLTPYEPFYVIRLQQKSKEFQDSQHPNDPNAAAAEVVLAPIWVTNPIRKPVAYFFGSDYSRSDPVCMGLLWGGKSLLLQEAVFDYQPDKPEQKVWKTIATLGPDRPGCYDMDTSTLSRNTKWRVVDPLQPEVFSEVSLTLRDALSVSIPYTGDSTIYVGQNLPIKWVTPRPQTGNFPPSERVVYSASSDGGATWTQVDHEQFSFHEKSWNFPTAGWGDKDVMIKVESETTPGLYGVTPPFHVVNASLPGGFFRPGGQDAIYNSNGLGHFCGFPSWNSFLMAGGRMDSSNVTVVSSMPTTMSHDGVCAAVPFPSPVKVYRFRNTQNNDRLLTLSSWEVSAPWVDEWSSSFYVFSTQAPNTVPLYRCGVTEGGWHFASLDPNCEGQTVQLLYGYVYTVQVDGTRPLYRNYSTSNGDYLITWSASEGPNAGYQSQGILGYIPN